MSSTERKYTSKRFLIAFVISAIAVFFIIGLSCYIIDPFLQFRVRPEAHYILNPRFVNGGLAKNYEYNTALIGSSMLQSFDVATMRKAYDGMKPVKLSSGGMNLAEMKLLYSLLNEKTTKNIILNIDMPFFNQEGVVSRYPRYLYEDGILNKMKYMFGYESLIQYLPADLGLELYFKLKDNDVPAEYRMKTDIDQIGTESYAKTYSAEFVKNFYLAGNSVLYQHTQDIEGRMNRSMNNFIEDLELYKHKDVNYTFMFPSYSALYWYHTQRNNYYEYFLGFSAKFTRAMEKYENVRIISFMDIPEINDLNYYGDVTHFSPELADKIMRNIYNPEYEINASNVDSMMQRVDSLVNVFIEENKDWLPR
ncbi:hypothetical protein [Prevotella sp. 10(H)]|uniref:hypothetical protein n=1 Tax=Prevotella sp. 10(H) TaxID=1158294 RepID=UPI0004A6C0CE|nr:hypothetical protein [Prevotella sp. 10(H)]